ncbi:MAG TPA: hypothetical protein PKA64_14975, partial [Myxococcota bacterium]|nr:hypothetical protein [Myxococcota bacterium]
DACRDAALGAVGPDNLADLLARARAIAARCGDDLDATEAAYRAEILASARLGPIARSVIQLWYLGSWPGMPAAWRATYGAFPGDTSRVISAAAYQESLVYRVAQAHPPGAKQPGYGSWAARPGGEPA